MPSSAYVYMARNTSSPVTLLVYTEEPYDMISVEAGPRVCFKHAPPPPPPPPPFDAPRYVIAGRAVANTTSGEISMDEGA